MATTFLDLQNGWYNGFLQGMGQSEDSFQILQPAPPLLSGQGADAFLWSYFNNIPPDTLNQQFVPSGGNQFFSNYKGLLSALEGTLNPPPDPKKAIGEPAWTQWMAYLQTIPLGSVSVSQLPTMYRNWAMFNAPGTATAGATAYSQILLDPVISAQVAVTELYPGTTQPDWSVGYGGLTNQLAVSPNRAFNFSSETMNTSYSGSWSSKGSSAFFGVYSSSSSTSEISTKFAESTVTLDVSFDHVMPFVATPGNWYSSSATGLAFSNESGNPWNPASSINWQNTFGSDGKMQRFAANLLVASGMMATVTSSAVYDETEQETIKQNSGGGFWPFYSGGSGSSHTSNSASFKDGQMTITTSSIPGVPIVLGCNVLPAGQFLGHSAEAAMFMREAASNASF